MFFSLDFARFWEDFGHFSRFTITSIRVISPYQCLLWRQSWRWLSVVLLFKTPLRNKSMRSILFYLLKKHDVLKITHLINFSKVLLWFSGERDVGTWGWKPLVLWIVGQNLLTPKKYIRSMCKRLWRHTIIFDWKCTEVNFRGNIDYVAYIVIVFTV